MMPTPAGPPTPSRLTLGDVPAAIAADIAVVVITVSIVAAAIVAAAFFAVATVVADPIIILARHHASSPSAVTYPGPAPRIGHIRPGNAGAAKTRAPRAAQDQTPGPGLRAGRAMRATARLMPRAVGQRWLGEAQNFLSEVAPDQRARITRNYLTTAPQVIAAAWTAKLTRRLRRSGPGRATKTPRR